MSTTFRIDLSSIDVSQFKLTADGDDVLIQPLRTKHRWHERELHLRSVVTDARGFVRSAGFPKFFNHGEHPPHDALFADALARGGVRFAEKLDGSLLVADRLDDGDLRLRTRGSLTLNEFDRPVRDLLAGRYPRFAAALADPALRDHSVLLEFVSPDHPIVVRYGEPALYLLGLVCKRTLQPRWDDAVLSDLGARGGVPVAPAHALPQTVDGLLASVREWSGREGVVARFEAPDVGPVMLKLKAAEYLRLHAYRARLGGHNARRLAFLLELETPDAVLPAIEPLGLDYEAAQYLVAELGGYFTARRDALARLEVLRGIVEPWIRPGAAGKRDYVERVRGRVAADATFAERFWFDVAMKLYDRRADEARLRVLAELLGEPVPSLRAWSKARDREIQSMLNAAVPDEG
jgi:hypothetical protein